MDFISDDFTPEDWLPFAADTALPVENHLRAIGDVAIHHACDLSGELKGFQLATFTLHISGELCEFRSCKQRREHGEDAPWKDLAIKDCTRF